jgi:hypothetical protein
MPFTAQLLGEMDKELPGDVVFIRGYVGEVLAGASLCVFDDSTMWVPMIGLRYEIARPSYLYFLQQDEMIRLSIKRGVRRILGGKANIREKQRHGFHQEGRWFCYRANSRLINKALALISTLAQRLFRP